MKLYVNNLGQWVGTQAEAKKIKATAVNVPTDKPNLLNFLNENKVCGSSTTIEPQAPQTRQPVYKMHTWENVRQCAEKASFSDMGYALAVLMNRLEDAAQNETKLEKEGMTK